MDRERDLLDEVEVEKLATEFDGKSPQDVIAWSLERWGAKVGICTSFQAEGMVLLDMACRINPDVHVFTVDTGRLHQETYDFIDQVRDRYGIDITVYFPDAGKIEEMTRRHGPNSFYKSPAARFRCCHIRKVEPITRALSGLDAWITGLRRRQGASRAKVRKIEIDHDNQGIAKIIPVADWSLDAVWEYIELNDVPRHPLYAQGYTSIGCAPCTRPTQPGEDLRAGRWWWEMDVPKECGIHQRLESGGVEHELQVLAGDAVQGS